MRELIGDFDTKTMQFSVRSFIIAFNRDCCPNILLKGFVSPPMAGKHLWRKKGFGGGYVSFIVKSLSFIVLRLKTKPIRSRLVVLCNINLFAMEVA
jgi:hypothetical protein